MLSIFTRYLIQYGKVCIPGIGTFELVCHSPQLDIAEKIFRPPFYITRFEQRGNLSGHQADFFANSNGNQRVKSESDIISFGEELKTRIAKEPFEWKGLGTLSRQSNQVYFDACQINLNALGILPANKVLRENVKHQVLVGDQEVRSGEVTETLSKKERSPGLYLKIGWIILIISILGIVFLLFMDQFHPSSSGNKLPPGFLNS